MVWQIIVVGLIAYLLGSINPAIILSNLLMKEDIRTKGSGNAGTTNVLRTMGKWQAGVVLIIDILKAVVAVFIGKWIATMGTYTPEEVLNLHDYALMAAGFGVVLGHNFPIFYGFKGGKGVATSLGVILSLDWKIGLICLVFAIVIMLASRMVSLGSITAAFLFPVLVLFYPENTFNSHLLYIIFAIVLALMLIYRHRANIRRLLAGTENKLWEKKDKKELK